MQKKSVVWPWLQCFQSLYAHAKRLMKQMNEIAQENHFGYVYKVNATSTCVYNTSEEVDAYLSQGDIFVTDKEITYGNMVKVWFQTDSGEIIQGYVAWNENSAGYYECIG